MKMAVDGVVEVTGDTILKPSSPHPLSNTLVPLNIFDKLHRAGHVPVIYAFRPPMPDNDTIKEALSKTLSHFPHFAARLVHDESGHPCFILNNAGVRVVETFIPTPLEEHLPFEPSTNFGNLYLPSQGAEEMLLAQLNRFSCGGLAISVATHHFVSDGVSSSLFLNAWAKLARGGDVDPLPYHDRAAVAVPRNPPHSVVNHREREFFDPPLPSDEIRANPPPVSYFRVLLSREFVAKLKEKVTGGDPTRRCSTFLCVLTHVWKKVTRARGLGDKTTTQIRVGVNGRPRLQPPVPTEYFGNLVLFAAPTLTAGELLEGSYSDVVGVIQEALAKVDNDYFRSFIDFDEILKEEGVFEIPRRLPVNGDSVCPDIEVATWLGLRLNDLDFGGGKPCAFVRPDVDFEGMLFLMPSCEEEGGVDVCVSLMKDHATYFKQNVTSIDSD